MQRKHIIASDLEKPENFKLMQVADNIDFDGTVSIDTNNVEGINFSNCSFESLNIYGGNAIPIKLNNCICLDILISEKIGPINITSLKECKKIVVKVIEAEKVSIQYSNIDILTFSNDENEGHIKEIEVANCIISDQFNANIEIDSLVIRGKNNIKSFGTGSAVKRCSVFEGGNIRSYFSGVSLNIGAESTVFFSNLDIGNFVCRFNAETSNLEVHDSTINQIHFWPNKETTAGRIKIDNCQIINSFSIYDGALKRIYLSYLNLSNTYIEFLNQLENDDFIWDNIVWPSKLRYYYSIFMYHDGRKTIRNLKQKAISIEDKFSITLFTSLELRHKFETLSNRKLCKRYKFIDENYKPPPRLLVTFLKLVYWFINPFVDLYRVFFSNIKGFPRQDRISLYISKYSNSFGQDWVRSILFTTIGAGILFYFYGVSLIHSPFYFGWNGWFEYWSITKQYFPYYIKFLNPVHNFELIEGYEVSALSSVFGFFGRIYISFGYYQVIRAFRKYF